MFVTIWMCTHEWSLISRRLTAFTFETCHHAFTCASSLMRSTSAASLRFARVGHLDPHLRHRLGGRQMGLFLRLLGDRILDPLLGLLVELGHEPELRRLRWSPLPSDP